MESVEFLDIRIYKGRVILAGVGPEELNGLTLHQAPKHSLRVIGGEVKISESVSGFKVGLNIQDNERTISTFRHHLLCRVDLKSFVEPLLFTVAYSLRNNYIQLLPTSNFSSSLNITPSPITSRFITPCSPSLTQLYQTPTITGTLSLRMTTSYNSSLLHSYVLDKKRQSLTT